MSGSYYAEAMREARARPASAEPDSYYAEATRPPPREQPAPEPQGDNRRWWQSRARDAIEGLPSFLSAAADALSPGVALRRQLAPAVQQATGVNIAPTPSLQEYASSGADALNLPRPETADERRTSAIMQGVVSSVPTLGAGLAAAPGAAARTLLVGPGGGAARTPLNMLTQLAAGGAGGAGANYARENLQAEPGTVAAQLNPVVEAAFGAGSGMGAAGAGNALRGAGRAAGAVAQPFFRGGQEAMVRDIMMRASADPMNLATRVQAGLSDPEARLPGAPVTTAQAARDNGLLGLEYGLRQRLDTGAAIGGPSSGAVLRNIEAQRNALRDTELAGMADNLDPSQRGAAVRGERAQNGQPGSGLAGQEQAARARVSAMYRGIDPDGTTAVPLQPVRESMEQAAARFYGPGSGGPPEALQGVLAEAQRGMREGMPTVSFEWLQNMRRRLGGVVGTARAAGDEPTAVAATAMREALEQRVADAAQNGQGFTPQQRTAWQQATAARAEMGRMFGRDETGAAVVGSILRRDPFGAPTMAEESVPGRALSSPGNLRQTLRAAGSDADNVRRALQGQFIETLTNEVRKSAQQMDSSGTATNTLGVGAFDTYMRRNARILPELFTPPELARLNRLWRDFNETNIAQTAGRANGSPTMQHLSVGNLIARASNGLLDPGSAGWQTLGSFGGMLRPLFAAAETNVQAILAQAMTDPQFAQVLMARATPTNIQRAANYVNNPSIRDRLMGAAGGAALRQGVRTAGEQERQRQQP